MCNFSDAVYDRGIREGMVKGRLEGLMEGEKKGRVEGRQEGRIEGTMQATIAILNTLSERLDLSFDQAMDLLAIPEPQRATLLRQLDPIH